MSEPMTLLALASFGLLALGIAVTAGLKGWQGWLDLKRYELAGQRAGVTSILMETGVPINSRSPVTPEFILASL